MGNETPYRDRDGSLLDSPPDTGTTCICDGTGAITQEDYKGRPRPCLVHRGWLAPQLTARTKHEQRRIGGGRRLALVR